MTAAELNATPLPCPSWCVEHETSFGAAAEHRGASTWTMLSEHDDVRWTARVCRWDDTTDDGQVYTRTPFARITLQGLGGQTPEEVVIARNDVEALGHFLLATVAKIDQLDER